MFWNGNYVATREISTLIKDENVTLTQLLEADDIIQECQNENKTIVQFLTRSDVIAELVGLITEEPSSDMELQQQYRYATVACEVLTSGINAVNERLSSDTVQMHRLCDFLAREPPLNPLLASFFSKTLRALLEQSHRQDWYSYHIICLHVLEFIKARTDFLPNLFRHMGTSAIADIFKYLIRLDLASKLILQWFEEHQFLEVLIQMICGTYVPDELHTPVVAPHNKQEKTDTVKENGDHSENSNEQQNLSQESSLDDGVADKSGEEPVRWRDVSAYSLRSQESRVVSARSVSAASLVCEIVLVEGGDSRPVSGKQLMMACKSERFIGQLLQSVFTAPSERRRDAVVGAAHVLLAALRLDPTESEQSNVESRAVVVAAIAPHLPLLHQTLLQEPPAYPYLPQSRKSVGLARLQVATLIAALADSPAKEVVAAITALGTLGTLLDMFLACPGNNLLHAQVYRAVAAALHNAHDARYARHLILECDLLTRLMDAVEENEHREGGPARSNYMGHVVLLLELLQQVLDERLCEAAGVTGELLERWNNFQQHKMQPLFRETPLGGHHPGDSNYEPEAVADSYDSNMAVMVPVEGVDDADDNATDEEAFNNFYYLPDSSEGGETEDAGGERRSRLDFDDDDDNDDDDEDEEDDDTVRERDKFDSVAPREFRRSRVKSRRLARPVPEDTLFDILETTSPWELAGGGAAGGAEEGWAQFADKDDQQKFGTTLPEAAWDFRHAAHQQPDSFKGAPEPPIGAMESLTLDGGRETTETVSNLITAVVAFSPDEPSALAEPAIAGTEPVTAGTEPVTADTEPVTAGTEPVTADTEPVTAGTEPVTADTEPVTADTEPVTASTEPAGGPEPMDQTADSPEEKERAER